MTRWLFSLHSGPAAAIFAGEKRIEFRRGRVDVAPGDFIVVYETKPTSAVTGGFKVGKVVVDTPDRVLRRADLPTREAAGPYLEGAEQATAIFVASIVTVEPPIGLERYGLERPPQSYRRLPPPVPGAARVI